MSLPKPTVKPANPCFSSGPCAKRPGWSTDALRGALLGRSHRSKDGKAKLKAVIDGCRSVLGVPDEYRIGITAASDTGAIEMALWSMLGPRPVDVFAWESFGQDWVTDIVKQLKVEAHTHAAPYGQLPDLSKANPANDVVFCWNGTTSGVAVPNAEWIAPNREGLTFCDATSAAFAMPLTWNKLDVTTFSWQKALGSEAQHGIIILSPRAIERLQSYTPAWPMPKIFRLTSKGAVSEGFFQGDTINTPSMLCVEDMLDALAWAKNLGGLQALIQRSQRNLAAVAAWVERTPWVQFLCGDAATRSSTSICLTFADASLSDEAKASLGKTMASLLEKEGAALDAGAYRDAPGGLRLWGGCTVETADLQALFPWLEWAYTEASASLVAAA
jgi:phosphoserine aminotransferase